MATLNDLLRAARAGDRGALSGLQERRRSGTIPEFDLKEISSMEKAAAKADREQQSAMAAAER